MMNLNRYGGTPASKVLVELVKNDKYLKRKIGSYWNYYTFGLNQIENIQDVKTRRNVMIMWRNDFIKKIDNYPFLPVVATHFKNVAVMMFREHMHDNR